MHARTLVKRTFSVPLTRMKSRPPWLALVILLGALLLLVTRSFSGQGQTVGSNSKSDYLSSVCSEFLNWAPGSGFLSRGRRLTPGGYPATSFHNILIGIVSTPSSWPAAKETVLLWWQPNVTRGFVWVEAGELSLQMREQQEQDLIEIERSNEDTDGFTLEGGGSPAFYNRTEGYGQEPVIQLYDPSVDVLLEIVNGLQSQAAQAPSDIHWFLILAEDAILNVDSLAGVLNRYDPAVPHFLGYDPFLGAEREPTSLRKAFSGPGFAISQALARELALSLPTCLGSQDPMLGQDQRLYLCVAGLGVPFTPEPGFHEDRHSKYQLEKHPPAPFVAFTLAHEAFQKLQKGSEAAAALQPLIRHMHEDPAGFLQHAVCVDRELDLTLFVSWGHSVRLYLGVHTTVELLTDEDGLAGLNTEDKDPCRAPAFLAAEDVKRLRGSGNTQRFESLYMRSQLEGRLDSCSSVHASIQSVRVVRKAEMFSSGSMYAGPGSGPHLRRQCCRYAFTDGTKTILNVGLSTCLAGQTLTQEPDIWASPL